MNTEIPGTDPPDEDKSTGDNPDVTGANYGKLTDEYTDASLTSLFRENLPSRQMNPNFANKLTEGVLRNVREELGTDLNDPTIDATFSEIMNPTETEAPPTFKQRMLDLLSRAMGFFRP